MSDAKNESGVRRLEADLGLKRLSPTWAKCEIFLGLACVWLSFHLGEILGTDSGELSTMMCSLGLFVAGGYLAMAGSRSHLYQSANRLTAHVVDHLDHRSPPQA